MQASICVCGCMVVVFFGHLLTHFYYVAPHSFHHHRNILLGLSICVSTYCVFVGFRYPPSSRQTSHEEGMEWLRSHSTGGLQDTGSQSPLSPPGASCTNTGKYHYSNLCKSVGPNSLSHIENRSVIACSWGANVYFRTNRSRSAAHTDPLSDMCSSLCISHSAGNVTITLS